MLALVIPYFKIKYFEETLASLAIQTDKRFKVYIGDDASPESPENLLENYANKFDLVYNRFETNLGGTSLTQQWERCIKLADTEEWVMILGDDDVLDKNVVETFYSNLKEAKSENVIRFASCKIDENGDVSSNVYYHPQKESSVVFLFKEKKRNSLSEYVFRKSQIIEIGFKNFPLAWCSDILAVLEFSNFGLIYSINEAIVSIRVSGLSISGNQENSRLKHMASEEFSRYIIFKKFQFFNKTQRLSILNGYEVAMKRNRKLKIDDWLILFNLYFRNFSIVHIFKLFRRFFIYIFQL
ncbi:glycosyltransferase family 2 protein [Flavobacterium gyeonganense]|uniref:Glycosyltransferase family 2 protein n=1 Tax=Flavobacterium gyeonganense TaxID=1310418 RepID=A0ABV5H7Y4_9FLAO|nr:glycosyltransferase family 2 protein [Flavobacterium gyeonganense]